VPKFVFIRKINEKISLESDLGIYYVMQSINERIIQNPQPVNPIQPIPTSGNILDRLGVNANVDLKIDLMEFGGKVVYGDLNLGINSLLIFGNQTNFRSGLGVGFNF